MSEAENLSHASVQESIAGCERQGELDIFDLMIASRSLRSFIFQIEGSCCPGFKIGWVSTVTARFFYGHIEIGELTFENTPVVPDGANFVTIPEGEYREDIVNIKSMVGFESFFDDLMPKSGAAHWLDEDERKTTAAMSVSPDGHHLALTIDLAKPPRIKCEVRSLTISDNRININMRNTSSGPINMVLDADCEFVLLQDKKTVGNLLGMFNIHSGTEDWVVNGTIQDGVSGVVLLKGVRYREHFADNTWYQYFIQSFEVEINVDRAASGRVVKKRKLSTRSSEL